jgi:uncharacterized protein
VRDADAARAFYGRLLGWTVSGDSGRVRSTRPRCRPDPYGDDASIFEVFSAVADLDASLGQVTALGGRVTSEINDSPGFGRWAECTGDHGVRFGLREPSA